MRQAPAAQFGQLLGQGADETSVEVASAETGEERDDAPHLHMVIVRMLREGRCHSGPGERTLPRPAGPDDHSEGTAGLLLVPQSLEDIARLLIAALKDRSVLDIEDLQPAIGFVQPARSDPFAEQFIEDLVQVRMQPLGEADRFAVAVVGPDVVALGIFELLADERLGEFALGDAVLQFAPRTFR